MRCAATLRPRGGRIVAVRVAQDVDDLVGRLGDEAGSQLYGTKENALQRSSGGVVPVPGEHIFADLHADVDEARIAVRRIDVGQQSGKLIAVGAQRVELSHSQRVRAGKHFVLHHHRSAGRLTGLYGLAAVVVHVGLVRRDGEVVYSSEREDGIVVVVRHLSVGTGIDGDGVAAHTVVLLLDDVCIAEGSHIVALLLDADDGRAEPQGYVRGVIAELLLCTADGSPDGIVAQRIAGIQHLLVAELHVVVVVHARLYSIRYRRQLHGKLTRGGVGVDDDHFQRVGGRAARRIGRAAPEVVLLNGLVIQPLGVVVEGALRVVEHHIHAWRRTDVGAGHQRQRGSTDVGVAQSEAQGLFALRVTTHDASGHHDLRDVGEGQLANGVVEVVHVRRGIAAFVHEQVAGALNTDVVLANGHADGVGTVSIAAHDAAVGVLHGILAVVDVEHTAVHRIGGVLVIHEAFDVEAAVVGEVLLEVQGVGGHSDVRLVRNKLVGSLRRNDVVVRLLPNQGDARHRVVSAGIADAEESELVARGQCVLVACTTHDGGMVLVQHLARHRVVVGGTHGADAFVEGPVSHQTILRATQHVVIVLQYGGLRQGLRPEAHLVDVSQHGLRAVTQRTDGHTS